MTVTPYKLLREKSFDHLIALYYTRGLIREDSICKNKEHSDKMEQEKSFPQEIKTHIVQDILVINTSPITLATWCEHWLTEKIPDAGKYWRQKEQGLTGWGDWMASPTQWTGVWVDCGKWWRTGKAGVLGVHMVTKVRHDWVTKWQPKNDLSSWDNQSKLETIPGELERRVTLAITIIVEDNFWEIDKDAKYYLKIVISLCS